MQRVGFLEKLKIGFNFQKIKESLNLPLSQGFLYLLVLILIFSIIVFLALYFYFSSFFGKTYPEIKERIIRELEDFPEIRIKNGEISSSKDPFEKIIQIKEEKFVFVIDTKASYNDVEKGRYKIYPTGVFFLKDKVIVKEKDEIKVYPLSETMKGMEMEIKFDSQKEALLIKEISSKGIKKTEISLEEIFFVLKKLFYQLLIFGFPFFLLFYYLYTLIKVLILSLIPFFVAKLSNKNLTFSQTYNLSIFSFSLPLLFWFLSIISLFKIPFTGWLGFLAFLFYSLYGVSQSNLLQKAKEP